MLEQVQPAAVRQVHVKENEIRVQGLDRINRLAQRVGLAKNTESLNRCDVGSMNARNPEVVVDDQRRDHVTSLGSRTATSAPGPSLAEMCPPSRCTRRWTSARPSPRCTLPSVGL